MAAQEGLNDDHRAAAFWAGLVCGFIIAFGAGCLIWRLIGLWLCIQQKPDLCDPIAADTIREEACVADAVEAGWQNVDQEAANELIRRQAHGLHALPMLDAIVFPPEGHGVGIGADEPVV